VLNRAHFNDPELQEYMEKPAVRLYAGPLAHVIMYSLKGGEEYNIVLLVPDNLPDNVRRAEGDTDEMMALFDGWDPLLRKFLAMVKKVDKWRLMHRECQMPGVECYERTSHMNTTLDKGLDSWYHPSGRVVLIGDAVHPMLPYLAQGANSAMEDGVVLGECLKRVRLNLPTFLSCLCWYCNADRAPPVFLFIGYNEREHPRSAESLRIHPQTTIRSSRSSDSQATALESSA
jgi:salicylate hydroxylase